MHMVAVRISGILGATNIIELLKREGKQMSDKKIIDMVDIVDEDLPPEMLEELSNGKGDEE